ncbi:hypothetical protein NEMBOFW57_006408 [Staphylotrichum longicolle]|uniref:Uncharacterized protein n=1 Tax=Staphylotrichum longicolle TaxID=669026 RepID=A0AAD4HZJ6_9PEZI|nr:hypothetical protein NEMBOFW57_006408 [Staphylotrichum longicolle]
MSGHSRLAPPANNKRKREFDRDAAFRAAMTDNSTLPRTYEEAEAVGWTPQRLDGQIGSARLPMVDSIQVLTRYRIQEPSVVDTPRYQVNWIARDPRRLAANGYCGKILVDPQSVQALANCILEVARESGSPFMNFAFEPVSWRDSNRHRQQIAIWAEEARARRNSPTTGCPPAQTADSLQDRDFAKALGELLFLSRPNAPQIRSVKWIFYDVLAAAQSMKFAFFKSDLELAWPWSNDFAQKVANASPGDKILQGKLHPSEFDYALHTCDDLPADPLFAGMTVGQILQQRAAGEFDADRFVPTEHAQVPAQPSDQHRAQVVLSTTDRVDVIKSNMRPKPLSTVPLDGIR